MRRFIITAALALLLVFTAGCSQGESTAQTAAPQETQTESLALQVTAEELEGLTALYPALKELDLTGSTCYAAIAEFAQAHPEISVTYLIDLGGSSAAPDTEELVLENGDYTAETLAENIKYMTQLQRIVLNNTDCTADELETLAEAVSPAVLEYTIDLLGVSMSPDDTEADISWISPEEVETAASKLEMLPNLTYIELMAPDGSCALSVQEVGVLQKALPDAVFHYTFELFGQTVSTTDERIEYHNKYLSDSNEEELRQALDILRGCSYFLLDNCHFTNACLAQVRDDYRARTKVVWRVWFGDSGSCLTDREVIRFVYGLYDYNCEDLKYCEDARFIDFGHNEILRDCSWAAYMPKLEAIILSGSMISDLTPFANCKSLKFLEIAYCSYIDDISPLAECSSLTMLNISYTSVADLTPLDELGMERLVATHAQIDSEEQLRFEDTHPDCLTLFTGNQPYGYIWRYEDDGNTPTEYYGMLREVFDYDHASNTEW